MILFGLVIGVCHAQVSPTHPGASADGAFAHRRGAQNNIGGAVLNLNTGTAFPSIQAAIDAASPGHTLEIQVAEIEEGQVLIDKDITLQGEASRGSDPSVVKLNVDTGSSGDDRAWFLVSLGVTLHVQDLVFDGNGHLVWQAFRHRGTGSFVNCSFRDIQFNASGPNFAGTAIAAFDFGGNLEVLNCSFQQIGRVGVLLFGAGTTGLIQNCHYAGKGAGSFLDYGFETGGGASSQLVNNRVSDCRGQAPDNSTSAGVLVSTFFGTGTQAAINGNALIDNTTGIAVGLGADSSAVTAAFNRIFGNTSAGLSTSSSANLIAENNWWGCNDGPDAMGCDGIQNDGGSSPIDHDPWLLLTLDAPTTLVRLEDQPVSAMLTINSDDVDTLGSGQVLDGIDIAFDGGLIGTVIPDTAPTQNGVASVTFVAETIGDGMVTAQLDNQSTTASVSVIRPPVFVPTLGEMGSVVFMAVLFFAGVILTRKHRRRRFS